MENKKQKRDQIISGLFSHSAIIFLKSNRKSRAFLGYFWPKKFAQKKITLQTETTKKQKFRFPSDFDHVLTEYIIGAWRLVNRSINC